jgi:hypothetical protein
MSWTNPRTWIAGEVLTAASNFIKYRQIGPHVTLIFSVTKETTGLTDVSSFIGTVPSGPRPSASIPAVWAVNDDGSNRGVVDASSGQIQFNGLTIGVAGILQGSASWVVAI